MERNDLSPVSPEPVRRASNIEESSITFSFCKGQLLDGGNGNFHVIPFCQVCAVLWAAA